MKDLLEHWTDAALRWSPAQPLFRQHAARQLTVLAYHEVTDAACFERQMAFLARSMRPVSIEDVHAALGGQQALPHGAVLVTFDDGHRSVLDVALPILEARGIPGVVYVVAGLIGTDTPYWWDEAKHLARHGGRAKKFAHMPPSTLSWTLKSVPDAERRAALAELRRTAACPAPPMCQLTRDDLKRLEAGGIAIGNHTLTHPCLNQCADAETVERELTDAHTILTNDLGHRPTSFAYPNGNADARAARVLDRLGYESGFLFDHRLSGPSPAYRFRLSRLRVNAHTPMNRFQIILSGLHPTLHHLQRKA